MHEVNKAEHEKAAARATDIEVKLAELREQLAEARDRLARVDDDEHDGRDKRKSWSAATAPWPYGRGGSAARF